MNSKLRQKAVDLRLKKELSYSEIRRRLKVPKSTLSYWLRDFPLSEKKILELRRKGWLKGEAGREKFRFAMRRKKEEKNKEAYRQQYEKLKYVSQDAFFAAGLMLYLAEGDKKADSRISLANTDPEVIKFFIKWLADFLGIVKEKIKVQLHLYENMDIKNKERFWRKEIGVGDSQLYKTQIRKLKKHSFTYSGSHNHGTCGIYVMGVDKKRELMMAIKAFMDVYKNFG